jgi:aspartate aminotransferase-like enzyme
MQTLRPIKTHLFTPGPTSVPDAVLRALAAPVIHHRTVAFQEQLAYVLDGMKRVMGTSHDVAMFSSSGTGAMESAVANLVSPGDEVVVAAFGHFGKRFAELATRYGATVRLHDTEWGQRPDADSVGHFAAKHPNARVIFTTHSETSTGTVSDAHAIASSVRTQAGEDRILVLDAISSLGAAELHADSWGWDVVVSGSQKALMVPPGLAFASVSPAAEEYAATRTSPRMYFDWGKTLAAQRKSPPSTAFTPALTIVLGLRVALEMILEEGLQRVFDRHVELGRAARAAVGALGLELFSPDDDSSCVLTAVRVPQGVDGTKIPGKLKEYGVTIAGGQAHLKGHIFRLGHCGWVNAFDLITCIAALERGLVELGLDISAGDGLAAAQRVLVGATEGAISR